ncbi:MAG: hypothetical protein EBU96_07890 [Actinobacteria bacterium]|nr:hypothetical protein [Actinomycetota bacterium]
MKREKTRSNLYARRARIGDDLSNIGHIKFGKSKPSPRMVDIDIELDKKAEEELPKLGLRLIAKDKQALINYVITKALENLVT